MKIYNLDINLMGGDVNVPYMLKLIPGGNGYKGGRGEVVIDICGMKINRVSKNTVADLAELNSNYFTNRGCPLNFEFKIRSPQLRKTKNFVRGRVKRRVGSLVTTLIQEGKIRFIS